MQYYVLTNYQVTKLCEYEVNRTSIKVVARTQSQNLVSESLTMAAGVVTGPGDADLLLYWTWVKC